MDTSSVGGHNLAAFLSFKRHFDPRNDGVINRVADHSVDVKSLRLNCRGHRLPQQSGAEQRSYEVCYERKFIDGHVVAPASFIRFIL